MKTAKLINTHDLDLNRRGKRSECTRVAQKQGPGKSEIVHLGASGQTWCHLTLSYVVIGGHMTVRGQCYPPTSVCMSLRILMTG